jgi:flagella basal body P-ring formation protein FlgA
MKHGVSLIGFLCSAVLYAGQMVYANAGETDQKITIDLKETAVVESDKYMLSDIATIRAKDHKLRQKLESLVIGEAPRVGYVDRVRKRDLLPRIERHMPGLHDNIEWKGADFSNVESVGVAFENQKVIGAAEHKLRQWLSRRYGNFTVKATGKHDDLYLPKGDVRLNPHLKDKERLNKRMNVWVDVFVGGRHYQSIPVWFAVSVEAPVLVATKEAKRGNKIIDNYVAEDVVDIATVSGTPAKEDGIANKRLKKDVKPGDVITRESLEDIPDVTKGTPVTVEASSGSVTIRSVAIALSDGMLGDTIEVRKPDTEIEYQVTVIGKNLVSADKE